ncbi:MAG: hypothetical protein ABEI78_02040, partial [Candidatus Nanohaloarchaea archaeon]
MEQQQMAQKYQQLQQQIQQVQEYLEEVEEETEEVEESIDAVGKLETAEEGTEVLAPIGSDAYAVAELKENSKV